MNDRSEVMTDHPGTDRMLADMARAATGKPNPTDADVTPDPYDGGCPADAGTARQERTESDDAYMWSVDRLIESTKIMGMLDAARYLRLIGENGAANAVVAETSRREAARASK